MASKEPCPLNAHNASQPSSQLQEQLGDQFIDAMPNVQQLRQQYIYIAAFIILPCVTLTVTIKV